MNNYEKEPLGYTRSCQVNIDDFFKESAMETNAT